MVHQGVREGGKAGGRKSVKKGLSNDVELDGWEDERVRVTITIRITVVKVLSP